MGEPSLADTSFVSAIDHVREGFTTLMDSGPPPPWVALPLFFVTVPLLVLVHELGHAVAALALLPGRVAVALGQPPYLVVHAFGRLMVAFHPWLGTRAECLYEAPASKAVDGLIAAAGPAASLVLCIVTRTSLAHMGPGLLHDALWVMTVSSLFFVVITLVPHTYTNSRGVRSPSDGATILAALR